MSRILSRGSSSNQPGDQPPIAGRNLINGNWIEATPSSLESRKPASSATILWRGGSDPSHIDAAIAAARAALPTWSAWPFEQRAKVLRSFKALAIKHEAALTSLIRDEVGKPTWDAKAEAQLLAAKVDITLDASNPGAPLARVGGFEVAIAPTRTGRCWFRPHGVMAVVGPFNFPAHLPNGHIVPALAMGNTIVFKPSDKAPAVGEFLAALFHEALAEHGAPPGVLNLVQGGADIASKLVSHDNIDGVLFTGSWPVGRRIMEANLDRPGRLLALEMGGSNAAVVMDDADLRQAAIECVRSAFITAGQRCTCTRRLIIHEAVAARLIPAICKAASALIIASPDSDHPVFMGPLISDAARSSALSSIHSLARAGGELLVEPRAIDGPSTRQSPGWYMSPGVMRVERFVPFTHGSAGTHAGSDIEIFAPFLRISVVPSLEEAIAQVNATSFGLAASIFTRSRAHADRFMQEARAGCVNWNTGTAGASSKLPFGGLGHSGNHRPAGAFSLDYCAYPVAGMVESGDASTTPPGMRVDDGPLA